MTTYTFSQLKTIWQNSAQGTQFATAAWADLMAAIALAESGGNAGATNPNDNGGKQTSWGLWQISLGNHDAPASNWADPNENARLAIGKLQTQGLSAWGTYTSGAYLQYLHGAAPPAQATATTTTTASTTSAPGGINLNPLSWVEAPIKGFEWAGSLITGVTGAASTIGDVGTGIAGIVRTLNKFLQLFLMLLNPAFWLRVGAFFVGVLALVLAFKFMSEAI